jgi:hypothetical protein
MVEPTELMLEHLHAVRGDMAKLADGMRIISAETSAIRQHLSGVVTIQEHGHVDITAIKGRLDRIERRLDLVE